MVSKSGLMNFLGAMIIALLPGLSGAQPLNDPSIHGMKVLPRVEGCNAAGGLQPITSTDDPGRSAMFWCGTPPHCLTLPGGNAERCHILLYSRNEPRYSQAGQSGANGVRWPEDLMCDVANVNPTGPTHATPGRCPVVPTLGVTVNGAASVSVVRGATVTLHVNTANATPMSAPTAYTMACTGAQAALTPFNQTNLMAYAGLDHTFSPTTTTAVGSTSCTVTAANAAGTATQTVSFAVTAPSPPSVSASFNPTSPTPGGSVRLTTSTSNANSLRWSCTGRWTNSNTNRSTGGNIRTNHTATGSAGTANCTFTATGPGGTATATASWRSTASGGSSSSGGSAVVMPVAAPCLAAVVRGSRCTYTYPAAAHGQVVSVNGDFNYPVGPWGGRNTKSTAQCNNGTFTVLTANCREPDTQ